LNQLLTSAIAKLVPPVLLLAAGLWAIFTITKVPPTWQTLLVQALPVTAIATAMLLSIQFNRSRYSLLLLFVALAGLSQTWLRGQLLPATESLLFAALIANSFCFSFTRDRSLFSIHGLLRLAILLAQALVIWYLATHNGAMPLVLLDHEWFSLPDSVAIFVQLPDGIIAAALIVNLTHMILSNKSNSSVQATYFGCQLGLLGIASGYPHAALVPFLVSSCGLMVTLAIIMDSHDMAYRDELTALPSRRALNQSLLSLGRHYSIAMLDIDHFKKFNDTHGHDIGDEVLRMVASRIARVGGGGKAFRYGGEEFTIVFAGKSSAQVETHLEALRDSIENYRMLLRRDKRNITDGAGKQARVPRGKNDPRHQSLSVTISIGYAERKPQQKRPEAVVKVADEALYRAKEKGRNCISS
jgi:diguanylate cyclase (GGDEF)-like protein